MAEIARRIVFGGLVLFAGWCQPASIAAAVPPSPGVSPSTASPSRAAPSIPAPPPKPTPKPTPKPDRPQETAGGPAGSFGGVAESGGDLAIRLGEVSAADPEESRSRHAFVDHVRPGTVIHRTVVVRNTSNRRLRVRLHPAAATVHDGRFRPRDGGNELTGWITLDRRPLELDGRREVTLRATIRVPRGVSTGERYAVLWAQADPIAGESPAPNPQPRVGTRIYLDVGPGAAPRTRLGVGAVHVARAAGGGPQLTASVRNTGHRAVDLTGSVRLTGGAHGAHAGPYLLPAGTTLAPGESTTLTVPLDRVVLSGSWRAALTVRSGTTRVSAQAPFAFPELPTPTVAKSSLGERLVHWLMMTGTFLSLGALGVAVLRYRRACRIRRELRR